MVWNAKVTYLFVGQDTFGENYNKIFFYQLIKILLFLNKLFFIKKYETISNKEYQFVLVIFNDFSLIHLIGVLVYLYLVKQFVVAGHLSSVSLLKICIFCPLNNTCSFQQGFKYHSFKPNYFCLNNTIMTIETLLPTSWVICSYNSFKHSYFRIQIRCKSK